MWWCGDSCANTSSQASFLFSVPAYPFPSRGAPYLWLGEFNSLQTALKPRTFLGQGGVVLQSQRSSMLILFTAQPHKLLHAGDWLHPSMVSLPGVLKKFLELRLQACHERLCSGSSSPKKLVHCGAKQGGCDPFSQYCCLSPVLTNHNPRLNEDDLGHIVCSESLLHTAGLAGKIRRESNIQLWSVLGLNCSSVLSRLRGCIRIPGKFNISKCSVSVLQSNWGNLGVF